MEQKLTGLLRTTCLANRSCLVQFPNTFKMPAKSCRRIVRSPIFRAWFIGDPQREARVSHIYIYIWCKPYLECETRMVFPN